MSEVKFYSQWNGKGPSWALKTTLPSCTIPDQSMSIQEIIAKFTRTGLVPASFVRPDLGGNVAEEPGFDPLDEYSEAILAAAREEAAAGADSPSPAGEGEVGASTEEGAEAAAE